MKKKIYLILIIIFSIIALFIFKDYFLGVLILISGILNCYYASKANIYNYIFGFIYSILSGIVCFKNGLYGIGLLSFIVYAPSQIEGYISWKKNLDKKQIIIRNFSFKKPSFVIILIIFLSFTFGFILSKVPGQKLPFLDSTSNVINIIGIILMNMRYKECWIIWLFNNTIDVFIWLMCFINNGFNSLMMLLVSISYLVINIYGIIRWNKLKRK